MANPFSNLIDEKLMRYYQNGENMAFDVIYSRYKDNVYSYLSKRLSNNETVDEVFQKTFIKFHKSRNNYDSKYNLLQWIYTITKSEFLDHVKKNKIQTVELKIDPQTPIQQNQNDKLDLDLEELLSQNEKEALSLRYYSDQDFSEISDKLNTSPSNARKLVSRGLKKLKLKYGAQK